MTSTDANSHLAKLIQTMIRPDGGTFQLGYYNSTTGAHITAVKGTPMPKGFVKENYDIGKLLASAQPGTVKVYSCKETGNDYFTSIDQSGTCDPVTTTGALSNADTATPLAPVAPAGVTVARPAMAGVCAITATRHTTSASTPAWAPPRDRRR